MEEVTEDSERMELTNEESGEEGNYNATLGKYWKDSYPELKPMDMVRADGMGGGIKMVISQQQSTVKVVNMIDCTDMNNGADPGDPGSGSIMEFDDPAWDRDGGGDLGIHSTVQASSIVYTVTDQLIETWNRNKLTKTAGELMRVTVLNRVKAHESGRRREIEVQEINEKGHGN
jgi:hypothetical protein